MITKKMLVPGNRSMMIIITVIVITVIADTSIPAVSGYTGSISKSLYSIALFGIIAIIYFIGQYFIQVYEKSKIKINEKNQTIWKIKKIVYLTQFILIGIIIIIICQMMFFGVYAAILLKSVVWINYGMAFILFGFFGIKLFLWNRQNPNSVLISYSIAILSLSINCLITIFYMNDQLTGLRGIDYIFPIQSPLMFISMTDQNLNLLYTASTVISFILVWVATVLMLHHYSARVGKTKYWIMVFIPLAYFLTPFQSFIPEIWEFDELDPTTYGIAHTLFFNASQPIGGILFGLAFWSVGRSLKKFIVRDYMSISAYGIMLFFAVNQPWTLSLIPYPPFGIPTICFVGLTSYLVLIGIYSSSLSISSDTALLRAVRRSLPRGSNLLGNIGSAQEIQKIQDKALNITNQLSDKITEETGIRSSLEDHDIKDYLKEILAIKEKERKIHDV